MDLKKIKFAECIKTGRLKRDTIRHDTEVTILNRLDLLKYMDTIVLRIFVEYPLKLQDGLAILNELLRENASRLQNHESC